MRDYYTFQLELAHLAPMADQKRIHELIKKIEARHKLDGE
jgi:hypothetical protein